MTEFVFEPKDVQVLYFRTKKQGPWLDSSPEGVRVTHLKLGVYVDCEHYRSAHRNQVEAFKELNSILIHYYELKAKQPVNESNFFIVSPTTS